jgi:CRISPR-associated protein Csx17
MAVRWHEPRARELVLRERQAEPMRAGQAWPVYALFRLLYLPAAKLARTQAIRLGSVDPAPLRLLIRGDLGQAVRLALRRYRLGQLVSASVIEDDPGLARRLAASLCFPIDSSRAWSIEKTWNLASSYNPRLDY